VTAQAMHGDREHFLAEGFDGYLSKPVNVRELIGTVRRHCDGRAG
jgi:CheY-like chemotaxis protein